MSSETLKCQTMTPKQKKKYFASGGNDCPFCDAKTSLISGEMSSDSMCAWRDVTCENCGKSWSDIYELVDVGEVYN